MTRAQIITLQQRIGTTPDGFWGPASIKACQAHLRRLMPDPNPWPAATQAALQGRYGSPGDESQLVTVDVSGIGVMYEGRPVKFIRANEQCVESLLRIIRHISAGPFRYVLAEFGGVFNNRNMRGGSSPSLHARGAAIDLMPGTNGLNTHWPTRATMPIEVMEIFAKEGWLPAGAFWSRDAMHFQATK